MTESPTEADKIPTTTAVVSTEGNAEEARPSAPPHKSVAPDGGWGWVVVVASFFTQALTIGITFTFGVIYPELLNDFNESESTTAWVGSIQCGVLYLTGVLAAPLVKLIGCRQVAMIGAAVSSTGYAVSAVAPNLFVLYVTYGAIGGIGNGLMYFASAVIIPTYFDKRRSLATGIAITGSGVGILFFGFVTHQLLERLHWRWTMVVEGGMMSLGVLCAMAYRPLPKNAPDNTGEECAVRPPSHAASDRACMVGCRSFYRSLIDFSYLRCPPFALFCIMVICFAFGFHVPFAYTPRRATRVFKVDPPNAALLISLVGVANIVSRPVVGLVTNRSATLRFYCMVALTFLCGLTTIYVFLMTTYTLMIVYSVLFGIFGGGLATLSLVVVVDMMGTKAVEKAIGLSLASSAIGFLIASPISGALIEATQGDYDVPFLFVGGLQTVSGFILLLARTFPWPGAVTDGRQTTGPQINQRLDKETSSQPTAVEDNTGTRDEPSSSSPRVKSSSSVHIDSVKPSLQTRKKKSSDVAHDISRKSATAITN